MKETNGGEAVEATEGCCSSYDITAVIVCSEPQVRLQKYNSVCVCEQFDVATLENPLFRVKSSWGQECV